MPEKSLVSEKAFLTCSPCNQTLCTAFAAWNLHYMIVVSDELAHEFVLFRSTPPKILKKEKHFLYCGVGGGGGCSFEFDICTEDPMHHEYRNHPLGC